MYAIWRSLGPQRGRGVVADVVKVWEVPVVNVLVVGLKFDRAFGYLQEMGRQLSSRRFVSWIFYEKYDKWSRNNIMDPSKTFVSKKTDQKLRESRLVSVWYIWVHTTYLYP